MVDTLTSMIPPLNLKLITFNKDDRMKSKALENIVTFPDRPPEKYQYQYLYAKAAGIW